MSTPVCRETAKQVHAELDKALRTAYREIGDLTLASSPGLSAAIRACDKMKLLLDNDFHGLWLMEREDREKLVAAEETRKREVSLAACRRPFWSEPQPERPALEVLRALLTRDREPVEEAREEESPLQAALRAMRSAPPQPQAQVTPSPVLNPEECDEELYT